MWTKLEIIKNIIIPLAFILLGFFLKHIYDKKERRHNSRIELTISTNIFAPQQGYYLVEFIITIYNKSLIKHEFDMLNISIHGIKKNTKIEPISFPWSPWECIQKSIEYKEPKC